MSTLYIDRKDIHIKLDGNAIAFYSNGKKEGIVPIAPLKRVIIIGNKVIETAVLKRLAEQNISVLFLSGRNMKFCGILHGRLHNNGLLRLRQYEKAINPDFCLMLAKDIIRQKIESQIEFLKEVIDENHNKQLRKIDFISTTESLTGCIESMKDTSSIDSIRGFEGGAQAIYFLAYEKLFPPLLGFKGRNRRPPLDPVNAMLSLVYTLCHYEVVREIEITGLDPTIGFYHQFEYGRESLACDIVELFRPPVDRFVYELFNKAKFTVQDFSKDESGGCYLKKQSRKNFYALYEEWAGTLRPQITEKVRLLARSIMDGKEPLS